MNMNRRNVLVGLGTVVAGGGAAFGSGAFSQASADRTLQVNVVTGENIADDSVDVLVKPGSYDSIGLEDSDGNSIALESTFPSADPSPYDSYASGDGYSTSDVSLIDNDVSIIIGTTDNNLPANSSVSYDPLFAVVNDDGTTATDFDVNFDVSGANTTFTFTGASGGADYATDTTVSSGSSEEINVDVNTADSSDTDATLTITIT